MVLGTNLGIYMDDNRPFFGLKLGSLRSIFKSNSKKKKKNPRMDSFLYFYVHQVFDESTISLKAKMTFFCKTFPLLTNYCK